MKKWASAGKFNVFTDFLRDLQNEKKGLQTGKPNFSSFAGFLLFSDRNMNFASVCKTLHLAIGGQINAKR